MSTLKTCFFESAGISGNPAVTTLLLNPADIKYVLFESYVYEINIMFTQSVPVSLSFTLLASSVFESLHYRGENNWKRFWGSMPLGMAKSDLQLRSSMKSICFLMDYCEDLRHVVMNYLRNGLAFQRLQTLFGAII